MKKSTESQPVNLECSVFFSLGWFCQCVRPLNTVMGSTTLAADLRADVEDEKGFLVVPGCGSSWLAGRLSWRADFLSHLEYSLALFLIAVFKLSSGGKRQDFLPSFFYFYWAQHHQPHFLKPLTTEMNLADDFETGIPAVERMPVSGG